jgi:hypothetical protein
MKTYVAEVDGEAILVFRAADDEAAQKILCVPRGNQGEKRATIRMRMAPGVG